MEWSEIGKWNNFKYLNFGSDPDHHADCPVINQGITQQLISEF